MTRMPTKPLRQVDFTIASDVSCCPPAIRASAIATLVAVLALCGAFCGRADAADRPNVLFLISDDLNNALGCYGHPQVKSPNIDRLAARGVLFERAYCQFPLCGPSRNSLLTGLYPNSTGIYANQQIFRQTIPTHHSLSQAFRLDGYFAGRIGKLYHYNVPRSVGTNGHDDPGSWELELNPAGCDRLEEEPHIFSLTPGQFGGTLSWYASPKGDEHHTDGLMATDAEWVLERCARQTDRPFFLAVGFFRPHTPYVAPRPYFDHYPEKDMPVVRGVEEDQADLPAAALGSYKREQDKLTDDLRRQCVQAYFASVTFMDAQVGRVLDALDRLGLAENTIIVFMSDHGYHLGEHGLWQKMSLFEESARVPLIIVAPGAARPGGVARAPVGLVDVYPTLTELCGVRAPENLQGQSLVPLLADPAAPGRGWALSQVTRGRGARQGGRFFGYSLRTPRWRYTEWDEGEQGRELYDHDADPRELTNLASHPAHTQTVAQLSDQLRAAVKTTFPPSGEAPAIRPEVWAPNVTDP
ncbi:MAG TPA: sulfatase [Planctomycetaceae bacterium]|nr:sulfatase [Planctomycetaceae bacterium]